MLKLVCPFSGCRGRGRRPWRAWYAFYDFQRSISQKKFPQISKRRDDLETVRRRQREARKERRRLEQEEGQGMGGGGGGGGVRDADYLEELAR